MLYLVDDDDDRNEELAVCKVSYPVSESILIITILLNIYIVYLIYLLYN